MQNKNLAIIILAAGKSTRMKSGLPKPLHEICQRPMLEYVLDLASVFKPVKTVAVLGFEHEKVEKIIPKDVHIALQKNLLGTADAVKSAMLHLKGFKGTVLILYADNPLLKKETILKLTKLHSENNFDVTLLTATVSKPFSYGRILRDKYTNICGIVEEKDADDAQKDIKEINTGIICFKAEELRSSLSKIRPNNRKKEFYLTDAIEIIYRKGGLTGSVNLEDINESLGINTRVELAKANKIIQARINEEYMKQGVTITSPETTFIGYGAKIGLDTIIYPFTVIEKDVTIGNSCFIGPFAHVRQGTVIEDDVLAGNFLELVRSRLGSKTLVKHFGYIGDSNIGKSVNIGAGTVTANFDGIKKSVTTIKDGAFIGSDTVLISPVSVGRHAKTGAGSVVVKNTEVPDNTIIAGVPARGMHLEKRGKR